MLTSPCCCQSLKTCRQLEVGRDQSRHRCCPNLSRCLQDWVVIRREALVVVRALPRALELAEARDRRRCLRCWIVMVMAMAHVVAARAPMYAVVRMRKAEVLGQ